MAGGGLGGVSVIAILSVAFEGMAACARSSAGGMLFVSSSAGGRALPRQGQVPGGAAAFLKVGGRLLSTVGRVREGPGVAAAHLTGPARLPFTLWDPRARGKAAMVRWPGGIHGSALAPAGQAPRPRRTRTTAMAAAREESGQEGGGGGRPESARAAAAPRKRAPRKASAAGQGLGEESPPQVAKKRAPRKRAPARILSEPEGGMEGKGRAGPEGSETVGGAAAGGTGRGRRAARKDSAGPAASTGGGPVDEGGRAAKPRKTRKSASAASDGAPARRFAKLAISIDGASRGNPGLASFGVCVKDEAGTTVKEIQKCIGVATCNVAEWNAAIEGLSVALELGASEVILYSDSNLVTKQLTGLWKIRTPHIVPLHSRALLLSQEFERFDIQWVPRAQNQEADRLANNALDYGDRNMDIGDQLASGKVDEEEQIVQFDRNDVADEEKGAGKRTARKDLAGPGEEEERAAKPRKTRKSASAASDGAPARRFAKLAISIDGASRGNPGLASFGVCVKDEAGTTVKEIQKCIGVATCNVAEWNAAIEGLSVALELGASEVILYSDSNLVTKQLTGLWKIRTPHIVPLHSRALLLSQEFERFDIQWVPRAQNQEADRLANNALDYGDKITDY